LENIQELIVYQVLKLRKLKMILDNCRLELSESGRFMRLKAHNGRIIMEALVHGPLAQVAYNCSVSASIASGRPNIFRGELHGLSGYEILDVENESIYEKDQTIKVFALDGSSGSAA
jgi:hypothetical protein